MPHAAHALQMGPWGMLLRGPFPEDHFGIPGNSQHHTGRSPNNLLTFRGPEREGRILRGPFSPSAQPCVRPCPLLRLARTDPSQASPLPCQ